MGRAYIKEVSGLYFYLTVLCKMGKQNPGEGSMPGDGNWVGILDTVTSHWCYPWEGIILLPLNLKLRFGESRVPTQMTRCPVTGSASVSGLQGSPPPPKFISWRPQQITYTGPETHQWGSGTGSASPQLQWSGPASPVGVTFEDQFNQEMGCPDVRLYFISGCVWEGVSR